MNIYWEFGNPQRRGSAMSPRSSLLPDSVTVDLFLSFVWLSLFFLLHSVPRVYQLSRPCGLVLFHWEIGDLGNRLISPLPFFRFSKWSYLSSSRIQASGIGYSSRILDIYMIGRGDITLEPEQEDICSVICRWLLVLLFGIGVLYVFPTTVISHFYYSKE